MTAVMPADLCEHLVGEAMIWPNREICGFILRGWDAEPIDNVAPKDREFYMDEQQQLEVMMQNRGKIIGVYHSHPSGQTFPSPKDIEYAPRGMRYWIIASGKVTEWVIKNGIAEAAATDSEVLA